MKNVSVKLGDRSYDIRFGRLSGVEAAVKALGLGRKKALVVTSRGVAAAGHAKVVAAALGRAGVRASVCVIPDGERQKSLSTVASLYRAGFKAGLDRSCFVAGVGGGVITDMAGFVAATYMRGIPFVSVPTTLLGMVDAAIGGKTGVDTPEGKNLIGAFWQPRLVWIDPAALRTLPERQWRTGFAEVAKYGVIADAEFFGWLEAKVAAAPSMARWKAADVARAIRRSAEIKAAVVSGDERETPLGGGREILNFGHTAGHALEAATGYDALSHGEAISVGMGVAGEIALATGRWSPALQDRMLNLLSAAGLPVAFPKLSAKQKAAFWDALRKDKKNVDDRLRFVLPLALGRVAVASGIPAQIVREAAARRGF